MPHGKYHGCIPDSAMFPTFDSWWIQLFESRGIDMTCGEYGLLLNLAIGGIVFGGLLAAILICAAWQAWRESRRKRMRRYRHKTRGKYFSWVH